MDSKPFNIEHVALNLSDTRLDNKKDSNSNSPDIKNVVISNMEHQPIRKTFGSDSPSRVSGKSIMSELNKSTEVRDKFTPSGIPQCFTNGESANLQKAPKFVKALKSLKVNNFQTNKNIDPRKSRTQMINLQRPRHLINNNGFIPKIPVAGKVSPYHKGNPYNGPYITRKNIYRPRPVFALPNSINYQIGSPNIVSHPQQVFVRPSFYQQGIANPIFQTTGLPFIPQSLQYPSTSYLRPQTQGPNSFQTHVNMNSTPNPFNTYYIWNRGLNIYIAKSLVFLLNEIKSSFFIFGVSLSFFCNSTFFSAVGNKEIFIFELLKEQEKCLEYINLKLEHIKKCSDAGLLSSEIFASLRYKKANGFPGNPISDMILGVLQPTKEMHEMCSNQFEDLKKLLEQKKYPEAHTFARNSALEISRKIHEVFSQLPQFTYTMIGSII